MRLLLLQNAPWVPALGGANKHNRRLLEDLAGRGHACAAVATAGHEASFHLAGVDVEGVADAARLRERADRRIRSFGPDWVLVASEDPAQTLLEAALAACPGRVVYLARTTLGLPFGPQGFLPSARRTDLLRRTAAILSASRYLQGYIRQWSGIDSVVLPLHHYGEPAELGRFDNGFVTLVNPCAVKGISLFLELARRLPDVAFAAVPTWGTTAADRAALEALANVRILPPSEDVDAIYAQTRVLLVPSLWGEAFGAVAIEAMLRGIPVLASDVGGLAEAKLGVDHLLPVRPIESYRETLDSLGLPVPEVPPQNAAPWEEALRALLSSREAWEGLSRESRRAAQEFAALEDFGKVEAFLQRLTPAEQPAAAVSGRGRVLKILLVQPLAWQFTPGGAHKANRRLLEGLAARGHVCRAVAPSSEPGGAAGHEELLDRLTELRVPILDRSATAATFRSAGVEVRSVVDGRALWSELLREIRRDTPDWVVVSEDPTGGLLEAALQEAPGRVVAFAHSPSTLPFGPGSFGRDAHYTELLRRTAGVLTVSHWMAGYIRQWGGIEAHTVYSPAYGPGPFRRLGNWDEGFVTFVNPSGIKGLPIFLELARRLPGVRFAAVPTWGTAEADRARLAELPNVTVLAPFENVDELFARSRVLLAPSLWPEAFGQIVVEAMLRGVPVLASDSGGLPEAKLGLDYILPVRPVEGYEDRRDERRIPIPRIPPQDAGPWVEALSALLADGERWERLAEASFQAANAFVAGLGLEPYERFFAGLSPRAVEPVSPARPEPPKLPDQDTAVRRKLDQISPEKLELLKRRLADRQKGERSAPAVVAIPRQPRSGGEDAFPLSFTQLRMWFLHQLEPGKGHYNESFGVRLRGRLDVAALAASLAAIVRRHESLRTRFTAVEGDPVQIVSTAGEEPAGLPRVDLRSLPGGLRQRETERLARAVRQRPFDLSRGPLLRRVLVYLEPGEHDLLIAVHHITADMWAIVVLMGELSALYGAFLAGRPSPLPMLPVQYADFAVWQREWLSGERLDGLLGWWRERLAGMPQVLDLPGDRPRPAVQSFRGASLPAVLPAPLAGALAETARQGGATLFMVLLAGFQALLHRWTGQDDLAVGSPIANRGRRELEGLIGCFINTLVLRGDLSGGPTGWTLLSRVREGALGAYAHQDLPFELLVEHLQPERSLSHSPLFQVMFLLQNTPVRVIALPEVEAVPLPAPPGVAKLDLMLSLAESGDGAIRGALEFSRDLFDPPTAARFLAHLHHLLEGMAADPGRRIGEIPLLSAAERHQLLGEWNDLPLREEPEDARAGRGLHEIVAAQALRTPEAPAAAFAGEDLTYAELRARASCLAARLRGLGCGPETRVAVALERSLDVPVALLGVLESGAAYVPLDPGYPRERLAVVMEDAAPRVLITEERLLPDLPPAPGAVLCLDGDPSAGLREDREPPPPCDERQLAYVLYTSGSTGRPKGVAVSHGAIVRFLDAMRRAPGFSPGQRLLAVTSLAFDIAALEIFLPLTSGGCVELARREEALDGRRLAARLRVSGAAMMQATPPTWRMLLDSGWSGDPGLTVLCGGEALPRDLAAALSGKARELWNLYGPTETTVWSAAARIRPHETGPVSIGPPIAGTRILLLDRELQPVPLGVHGELCIGGAGLARGYLGRPDLTAERFVPDPTAGAGGEPGGRLYRTGDLARHLPGGRMEVLGRLDHQVKVRGFRIEPGEIEQALAAHPGVEQAVAVVRAEQGTAHLVAWIVPAPGADPAPAELRAHLRLTLPDYMVPSVFVALAELPLTPNRKVDRGALMRRDPGRPAASRDAAPLAPRGALEETLAGIWRKVLGVERIGVDESFFDAGGHSLLLVQVQAGILGALEIEVPIVDLFRFPTIAALAAHLGGAPVGSEAPRVRVSTPERENIDLAIVGMAARLPGAPDLGRFWRHLRDGVESIASLSGEQLHAAGVSAAESAHPDFVPAEPMVGDIDLFDAAFFGFNPREAQALDPQQRLFLELAWSCLESAGYDTARYPGRIGVFAGQGFGGYILNLLAHPELRATLDPLSLLSSIEKDYLATRVSYKLGLRGPGLSVQTACSTSLVAVHLARQALLLGECEMALAGGVTLRVPQGGGYRYHEGGISSPDGHCRTFDAAARGTVFGSGAGVVLLKRLADALRDGDTIHAVLKGTAINNDGWNKVGFTAPSVDGQAEVIAAAQDAAGVSPDSITYVEAHGTATPLGDPIEVAALTQAFRRGTRRTGFCALGSVKSNVGHLDAAAGVTGLIKTVLALEHRQIPPSLHFRSPNPQIDFADSPFYVNSQLADWTVDAGPRRAGVSSFGIGGTNAHAILEEAPPAAPSVAARRRQLLLLSARTPDALEEATRNLAGFLEAQPDASLPDAAWTLQVGRRAFEHRRMLVCEGADDAAAALRDPAGSGQVLTRRQEPGRRTVSFLFPGQGTQYVEMGRELYEDEVVFRAEVDLCAEHLLPHLGCDLREILHPPAERRDEAARALGQTRFAQPALFAVEIALARLWISWGVRPQAMLGHSLGEYVAACLAGVFSLPDALELVAFRGALMQEAAPGVMLAAELPERELRAEVEALPGLSLAAVNAPASCVAAGPEAAVEALEARLTARGVRARRLHTSHAFHSAMMDPVLPAFTERVVRAAPQPPAIPFVSNLTGTWITAAQATDPGYWARHLRETVRFADGLATILAIPETLLLEVGPGRSLADLARRQGEPAGLPAPVSSLRREGDPEPDSAVLLGALGKLWLSGVEPDWAGVHGGERRRRLPLPTYPFQRQRYWADAGPLDLPGLQRPAMEPAIPGSQPPAGHARPGIDTPYKEPDTEIERRLAALWGALLGIDRVGIHDDFFELGGHSLLATRLISQVREELGREIPLETVFSAPTVARFAALLAAGGELPAVRTQPIVPVPRDGELPISFAQQRLLFLALMAPEDPSYNLPLDLRLEGRLVPEALRLALEGVASRHETLRTTFRIDESRITQVISPPSPFPLPLVDLAGLPGALREPEARRLSMEQARHPFDLLRGPVMTGRLVRLSLAEHLLLLTVHHIAADGWSFGLLSREVAELYSARVVGRRPALAELPVQYADFAAWQRARLQEEELERHLDYWRTHLAGVRAFSLPTDRPRPPRSSGRGAALPAALPAASLDAARRLAHEENATLFMVLLAAFKAVLHRASGSDDQPVGTDIANRNRRETEDLIGLFANQLVLRSDLSGNPTFRELLRRVRRTTLNAYAHQDAPFDRVVEALNPVRALGSTPLFQAKLVLQNVQMPLRELTDLKVSPLGIHTQTAKFDLLLNLVEAGDAVTGALEYSTDLWDAPRMASLLDDFIAALAAGTARPDDRLSRIAEGLSRPSEPPREERRTILRRRAIPVTTE